MATKPTRGTANSSLVLDDRSGEVPDIDTLGDALKSKARALIDYVVNMPPPLIASIGGVLCGFIPAASWLLFDEGSPLGPTLFGAMKMLADASVPLGRSITICQGMSGSGRIVH